MSLARKQQLCLDAIEHSFSMADAAYGRVIAYCKLDRTTEVQDQVMVLDAWSFVDVAKRLRSVIVNTPGLVHGPAYEVFLRGTKSLVDLRHYVQHLEDETANVAQSGRPIWGSFSWGIFRRDKTGEIRTYVPGRLARTTGIPVMNPAGREIHDEVDHFEMSVTGTTINLSDTARRITEFRRRFETVLPSAPTRGTGDDAILIIELG